MSSKELLAWNPFIGRQVFRSFVGKPTFMDHDNQDMLKAKGVNFDATAVYIKKYDLFKIVVLSGFDRTKDRNLVKDIEAKIRRFYSMGAWVDKFKCSVCKADAATPTCTHFRDYDKGSIFDGKLIFQDCTGIDFFEASSVDDPADYYADGNII